jgi:hypothetical protein
MIKVDIPSDIQGYDRTLLEKASSMLQATAGTTSSGLPALGSDINASATWSSEARPGKHPVYRLKLSDSASEVSSDFYVADLQDHAHSSLLPYRIARLWGDLLEKRSHRQLEELMKGRVG